MGSGGLRLVRTYNSNPGTVASAFGATWRFTYSQFIGLGYSTAVWLYRPDGKSVKFVISGNNYIPDADITDRLFRETDAGGALTGYRVETADRHIEHYGTSGRLVSITDPNGQMQTLAYDTQNRLGTVTDVFGHILTFTYDAQNRVATVTDPAGGQIGYTYDAANNLATVTYQDGKVKTYHYNEPANTGSTNLPNALTGITDENGVRYVTYQYDSQGRANGEFLAGNVGSNQLTFSSNSTMVTDALGTTRTYNFQTILGIAKSTGQSQPGGAGCGAASNAATYDTNGNATSRTDFNGNLTTYSYDLTRNLETSRVEASGTPQARTITTQWHASYRLPVTVAEPKRLTTYAYAPTGNLLTKTEQATNDASGAQGVAATLTGTARTWTYTYNAAGQVHTVTGPRTDVADVTTYDYDTQGNLITFTDAAQHVTTLSNYDGNGRVGRITDPNGLTTDLTYWPRGWLKAKTVGGESTTYDYDNVGQLKTVTLPDLSTVSYTYDDAHRLTGIADSVGDSIHYTLDLRGNRLKEEVKDPTGVLARQTSRMYDALNRLQQVTGTAQ